MVESNVIGRASACDDAARAAWRQFVESGDVGAAVRPEIAASWQRSRAAGIDPTAANRRPPRIGDDELAKRLGEHAELLEIARAHLDWLSAAYASATHAAWFVDRDGIVLYATGTAARQMAHAGLLPGHDWSERAIGTNGGGTALVGGGTITVEGAEHFAAWLHGFSCIGATVCAPSGEIVGAINLSFSGTTLVAERATGVAHAAYAIAQGLAYRESLRRTSGRLAAEQRLAEEAGRRLAALEALRESEARFAGAFEHSAIAAAITAPDGRWMRVNRALCTMLGYDESELLGRTFQSLTPDEDLAPNMGLLARVTAGEIDHYRIEKRLRRADGREVHVLVNAAAVRGADGAPLYLVAQFQDVSEARRAQAEFRASEERYRRLVEAAHEGICTVDGTGVITFSNGRLARMLGRTVDELVGHRIFELMPADQAFEARLRFARRQRGIAEVADTQLLHADGSSLWTLETASSLFDADGAFAGALYLLNDVTDRHRAALRLEESEQRYRSLFEHNPDAVISLDGEGRFERINAAAERLSGFSREELIGKSFAGMILPDAVGDASAHFDSAVAGAATSYTSAIRDASGRRVELSVTNIPIVVGGAVVGVFGIAKDLTRERELEGQLRQSQKMEAIGRLAGGVAHDFNNLLTVILAYTQLAMADLPERAEARADLREVASAAQRAASLTGQLLAFSRRQLLQPRRIDASQVVSGVAEMLRRVIGEDVALHAELSSAPWPVHADPGQLEQVLMNLALNARDAMPNGGTLRLSTANLTADRAFTHEHPDVAPGDYVALAVEDDGTGIEPTVLPKIFEPFYTTKGVGQGTGLGLSTVYGIIAQSGGHVYVTSTPGVGSRFTVLLPRDVVADEPERAASATAAAPCGTETVLLVEDDRSVQSAVRRMLRGLGYEVRSASGAAEALEIARLAHDRGERIDLVLTDLVMPDGSGRALGERLHARWPALPVVYMSGYTDDEIFRRGLGEAGAAFLEKPFSLQRLAEVVRRSLDAAAR